MSGAEAIERFDCFGSRCGVFVIGDGPAGSPARAAAHGRARLHEWHGQFSRFLEDSELSRLNRDERRRIRVSPLMARFAETVKRAGSISGGLVDATLLAELRSAGYRGELGPRLELERALAVAPPRRPGGASSERRWESITVDPSAPAIERSPGLLLDSGGLAKGLFADVLAQTLAAHESFAIDCGGDLALGGAGAIERPVEVQSPFDGAVLHVFGMRAGGVATSGIGRRSWLGAGGRPAHHLLDPATGSPAFTGVVQATALAPTAVLAEIHAKAAVLSGSERGAGWLPWGGVLVLDDASHVLVEAEQPLPGTGAGLQIARV
ncbi:MAG: FAD:protein FMN transferase [Solirubrobacteraceae bacterium]